MRCLNSSTKPILQAISAATEASFLQQTPGLEPPGGDFYGPEVAASRCLHLRQIGIPGVAQAVLGPNTRQTKANHFIKHPATMTLGRWFRERGYWLSLSLWGPFAGQHRHLFRCQRAPGPFFQLAQRQPSDGHSHQPQHLHVQRLDHAADVAIFAFAQRDL